MENNNTSTSIHQLANLILLNGWSIFGGYVRDMLAGDEPHDLDIFATQEDVIKLLSIVVNSGYQVIHISKSTYKPHGWNVFVEKNGEKIELDIINPGTDHSPDVDINRLVLSAGNINVMGGCQYDFSTIFLHIRQRIFVPERACPSRRIEKLEGHGWSVR